MFMTELGNALGLALGRLPPLNVDIFVATQKLAVIILCVHSLPWHLLILGNCVKQYVLIKLNVISQA